jgi:hypothetical protein
MTRGLGKIVVVFLLLVIVGFFLLGYFIQGAAFLAFIFTQFSWNPIDNFKQGNCAGIFVGVFQLFVYFCLFMMVKGCLEG